MLETKIGFRLCGVIKVGDTFHDVYYAPSANVFLWEDDDCVEGFGCLHSLECHGVTITSAQSAIGICTRYGYDGYMVVEEGYVAINEGMVTLYDHRLLNVISRKTFEPEILDIEEVECLCC